MEEHPWPQWTDPGFESNGFHYLNLYIFLAGTIAILGWVFAMAP
jgi:hypothetical protein